VLTGDLGNIGFHGLNISHRVARNGGADGSLGAATCLRIGLEPTGSASGDAVSPTPVPTASARVTDLHDLVDYVP
jgi:hypothetical protein